MSEITENNILQEAEKFLHTLTPQDTATVVGLYGDLGAGKTTFTKSLAKVLGITETVTSPTFVLEKIYSLNNQKFSRLIHIDAYRIENSDEIKQLGWDATVKDKNNIIVIEWADKVEDLLPNNTKKIIFKVSREHTREISYA